MRTYKHSWLIGPFADIVFFIATPLAIVPAFHFLSGLLSLAVLKLGVLSVSATGHHLPGFIRAYTDRSIFERFRPRLVLVPALFILLALVAAWQKLSVVFFILIGWSTWHGAMQILGFVRIYDVKAGFNGAGSAWTARLDFWMCLAWFVQVVLWAPGKKMSVLSSFYLAGGPLISVPWAKAFEAAWLGLTALVTAAWIFRTAANRFRHGYFNAPKLLCLLAGIGFWAYCMITVNHLIIGLLLWEIFHDLQYNVFVWNYNRGRVEKGFSRSALENFLFRLDGKRIALYAALIAAYGCVGLLSQDVLNLYQNRRTYETLLYQIGNVFAASAMIHFYLDGFIWKVRDGKVQKDLGVQALPAAADGFRLRNEARHWVLVGLFFLAAGGLMAGERFHWTRAQERAQTDNLVDMVPTSGYANFMKASVLRSENRLDSAAHHFALAIRHDTAYRFSHAYIAEIRQAAGDLEGALAHYREAVLVDPDDAECHFQLAFSLLQLRRGLDAKPHLERSLALDPSQPKALNYLGMVEQAQGNKAAAMGLYRKALELDSTYEHARLNLASADSRLDAPQFPVGK